LYANIISTTDPGSKISILHSESNDILLNLATEEYLFEHCQVEHPVLFLWRNTPTVIIGKHQNPWKECHVNKMEEDKVTLARRMSGGGCVYQDLGNSVFSFINPIKDFAKEDFKKLNDEIIIKSLSELGVEAETSGRNDVIVKERKVSGSAFKLKLGDKNGVGKRSLHHGTMLLSVELDALSNYLNPNKLKLISKGVSSVTARVINLNEYVKGIDHEMYCNALISAFKNNWEGKEVEETFLKTEELLKIDKLKSIYSHYDDYDWRFGQNPEFENQIEKKFPWGLIDIHLDVGKKNVIKQGKVYSDCIRPDFIDALNEELQGDKGYTYDTESIDKMLDKIHSEKFTD
jgi:lipoate-protein ligase A